MQSKDPTILRGKTIDEILTVAAPEVLPEDFPIWNGGSTSTIKKAILRHYYMREIGAETVGLWRYYLSTRLQEIMPWYVDLHERMTAMADIYINQLENVTDDLAYGHKIAKSGTDTKTVESTNKDTGTRDVDTTDTGTVNHETTDTGTVKNTTTDTGTVKDVTTDTGTREVAGTETGTVENSGTNDTHYQNLYSDTPQNGLTSVQQGQYLTNATLDDTTNTVDNTETRDLSKSDTETRNLSQDKTQTRDLDGTNDQIRNLSGTNDETRNLAGSSKELRNLLQTFNSTDSTQYGMTDTHSGTDARSITRSGFSGDKVDVLTRYKEAHINIMREIIEACGTCWLGVLG